MTDSALLILAAGMGSRYGGLKQIDPVGPSGEAIIDYSIHDALQAGFTRLVFVIRRELETEFREAIGKRYEPLADVVYVHQELDNLPEGMVPPANREKPWGTAHALLVSSDYLRDQPFAIINADDFYGRGSYKTVIQFLREESPEDKVEYGLVGFELRKTLSEHGSVSRGLCTSKNGYLASITEMTKIEKDGEGAVNTLPDGTRVALTGDELVSMNMWGMMPSIFDTLEDQFSTFFRACSHNPKSEFYIPTVMDHLITTDIARCRILPTSETWSGITYREDKPMVQQRLMTLIQDGVYSSPLQN